MSFTQVTATVLPLLLVVTLFAPAVHSQSSPDFYVTVEIEGEMVTFWDVPRSAWFAPHVRTAAEAGIVNGYKAEDGEFLGRYGPANNVTVEEMAKIALESSNMSMAVCPERPQNATAWGRWSQHYVACAEHYDWPTFESGLVNTTRPATRAEVASMLARAYDVDYGSPQGGTFNDVRADTRFAAEIEALAEVGIISGYADTEGNFTGSFGPNNAVNRAEVAKMVALGMEYQETGEVTIPETESSSSSASSSVVESEGSSVSSLSQASQTGSVTIDLEAGNYYFSPETIEAEVGQTVTVDFSVMSGAHTFVIDELNVSQQLSGEGSFRFTVDAPGTYVFYCDMPGHREAGMEGQLIVRSQE